MLRIPLTSFGWSWTILFFVQTTLLLQNILPCVIDESMYGSITELLVPKFLTICQLIFVKFHDIRSFRLHVIAYRMYFRSNFLLKPYFRVCEMRQRCLRDYLWVHCKKLQFLQAFVILVCFSWGKISSNPHWQTKFLTIHSKKSIGFCICFSVSLNF